MKKGFVQTQNFRLLKEAEKIVARRGAREAGLVLIQGVYGIGKSELTERWASESGHVFIRSQKVWTCRALLEEVASNLGLSVRGSAKDVQNRITQHLAVSMQALIFDAFYDNYKGAICFVRVMQGRLKTGMRMRLMAGKAGRLLSSATK